jgi:hypothetical protein
MTSLHLNDDQFTRYLMDPDADGAEAAHLLVCTVCRSHGETLDHEPFLRRLKRIRGVGVRLELECSGDDASYGRDLAASTQRGKSS